MKYLIVGFVCGVLLSALGVLALVVQFVESAPR